MTAKILWPAVCNQCNRKFDLGRVEVTSRYADCDLFKAPCCGAICDTRTQWNGPAWAKHGYVDMQAFERIEGQSYDGPILSRDGLVRVRGRVVRSL